ncbi:MAG: hypothetical protein ACK5Y2_04875 [Bdellovibrionales bacterium]
MKNVTEFATHTLTKGASTQAALAAEGKTPEEIQTSLGESFKYEGDKLKHFVAAIGVATQNPQNLRRVLVVTLAEGEKAPPRATQVEEFYYIPEALVTAASKPAEDSRGPKGRGKGRGGKGGGAPKGSPWGLSPEEKAAKNKGAAKPS